MRVSVHLATILLALLSLGRIAAAGGPEESPVGPDQIRLESLVVTDRIQEAFQLASSALARDLHGTVANLEPVVEDLLWLSRLARDGGDRETARLASWAALQVTSSLADASDHLRARAMLAHGLTARLTVGTEEAGFLLSGALSLAGNDTILRADILQAMANCRRRVDPWDDVAEAYRVALELRTEWNLDRAANAMWLAMVLTKVNTDDAVAMASEALEELDRLGQGRQHLASVGHEILASCDHKRGRLNSAVEHLEASLDINEAVRSHLFPGVFRTRIHSRNGLYAAEACVAMGDSTRAWRMFQRAVEDRGAEYALPSESNAELLERLQDAHQRRTRLLVELRSQLDPESDAVLSLDQIRQISRFCSTYSETMRLDTQLRSGGRSDRLDRVSVEEVRSILRPGEALVSWIPGFDSAIAARAFVIRRGGIHWVRIPTEDEGAPFLDDMSFLGRAIVSASSWPLRVGEDPRVQSVCQSTYQRFVEPLVPYLEGVTDLVVVPNYVGYTLPLAMLMDAEGNPIPERWTIGLIESPQVLVQTRRKDPGRRRTYTRALVLGDPTYSRQGVDERLKEQVTALDLGELASTTVISRSAILSGLNGEAKTLDHLPRLPYSRIEADQVAQLFPERDVLLGEDASEARLRAYLSDGRSPDVIHLASHALLHPFNPTRSALALARTRLDQARGSARDGLLQVDEIATLLRFDAELVTLSGCQTGAGSHIPGEAPQGFAQALRAAGARSVILSHWKVDDVATALLMGRLYADLTGRSTTLIPAAPTAPMSVAAALAEAQSWLRGYTTEDGRRPFRHPVYWAAFALLGDNR